MSEHYTESQVNQIEQDAHDGAILEAGKEWERQCDEFNSREYELESRIAELEAERRWIPVGERLPEANKCVLVYDAGGNMTVDFLVTSGEVEKYFWLAKYRILFWMPLPELPNDTQKETFVYGKDSKPIPCPFCGEIVKECNDVATPIDVALRKRIAELEAERDQAKAIVSRLRDFLFDYTQFHISTNPEERWWALVDKFDELVKEREE